MYQDFKKQELILRDHLALDRTILANERTLLAYIRTALTFFVAGVSFIQFFDYAWLIVLGWIFLPIGLVFMVIGAKEYLKMRQHMHSVRK